MQPISINITSSPLALTRVSSADHRCRSAGTLSYEPTEQELKTAIQRFSSLGLKVQVTQLDISIYPWENSRRAKTASDVDGYTLELQQEQLE